MADVLQVLQEALEIEQEGEKFYRQGAEGCEEEVTRRTFLSLADQERLHAAYFRTFYDMMTAEKHWPAAGTVSLENLAAPEIARQIFAGALPDLAVDGPKMCATTSALYEGAMERERAREDNQILHRHKRWVLWRIGSECKLSVE